ncbi:hypothetical protein NP493_1127g01020 [Ridgeia piscesae]|uniref:Uncharacterized protein n=1 Tax=Ridgeia piscesae TaxID=27915 RepID=A0AAD9KGU0_RIDPI|nr:hypothetical protein NP493_1127g01020 [Ridgeia piscesae]
MEWKNKGGVVQAKNESKGNKVKYTYITKVTPADNNEVFTCRTYFDEAQRPPSGDKPATNIPTTDNVLTVYSSPPLTVYSNSTTTKSTTTTTAGPAPASGGDTTDPAAGGETNEETANKTTTTTTTTEGSAPISGGETTYRSLVAKLTKKVECPLTTSLDGQQAAVATSAPTQPATRGGTYRGLYQTITEARQNG